MNEERTSVRIRFGPADAAGRSALSIGNHFVDDANVSLPRRPGEWTEFDVAASPTGLVNVAVGLAANAKGADGDVVADIVKAACACAAVHDLPKVMRLLSLVLADMAHAVALSEEIDRWATRNAALADAATKREGAP